MIETNPCRGQGLLVGSRELKHVPKGSDLNGTLDPIGPERRRDGAGDLEGLDGGRQIAILEVPPHRNPHVANLIVSSWRRVRVEVP